MTSARSLTKRYIDADQLSIKLLRRIITGRPVVLDLAANGATVILVGISYLTLADTGLNIGKKFGIVEFWSVIGISRSTILW